MFTRLKKPASEWITRVGWRGRLEDDNSRGSVPVEWEDIIPENEWRRLVACNLIADELVDINVGELRVQQRSEWRFDEFLKYIDGFGPRSVLGSPFFELANLIRDRGSQWVLKYFTDTSYHALFQHFQKIGWARDWESGIDVSINYDEQTIGKKIEKFVRVFESLEKVGYLGGEYQTGHILALKQPYEKTHLGIPHDTPPFEIWSGHHRAACLAALGIETTRVVLLDKMI